MPSSEFDSILRKALEDHRVSRGERRVLRRIIDELDPNDQQMSLLRHRAFAIAREKAINTSTTDVLDWLEDIVKVLDSSSKSEESDSATVQAWFSPGDDCVKKIVSMLKGSLRFIDICVFTITDNRLSDVILDCHRRGVKLRIITDDDKSEDRGSDIDRLESVGIPVRVDRSRYHMHHKFALFDHKSLLSGSYNWTRTAAEENEENFIVTRDAKLVKEFLEEFEKLWKKLA